MGKDPTAALSVVQRLAMESTAPPAPETDKIHLQGLLPESVVEPSPHPPVTQVPDSINCEPRRLTWRRTESS